MAKISNWQKKIKQYYEKLICVLRSLRKKCILPNWLKSWTIRIYHSWRTVLFGIFGFLFFYYFLGSQLTEDMDISNEYVLPTAASQKMETVNSMAFMLRREVDTKMWTPNLPPLFPAYVLDNMPNFQIGIENAIRDIVAVLQNISNISEAQSNDLQQAHELLKYAPNVWLLAKKGSFNIAPSSNTQYRKAAKYLTKFNERGNYAPQKQHLQDLLKQMSRKLARLARKSEEHWQEHGSDFWDNKADNIFYHHRGYAFALWQISKAMGIDFKEIILAHDAYTDWTYLQSSLRQAAQFRPYVVRNSPPDGLWSPNHLMAQNFYLARALTAIERIRGALARGNNAD